jgi:hypothetical protein
MKRNKLLILSAAFPLFCLSVFSNCGGNQGENSENRYPADSSELSKLMRGMWNDSDLMKKAILEGKMPDDFREKFVAIHTAAPTDADTKKENYDEMAKSFLASMDRIYAVQGDKEELSRAFNLMVNQCVACHQTHCPGPIVKIKKLSIQ